MLKEMKLYHSDWIPDETDIKWAIKTAKTNNCVVRIQYNVYTYPYTVTIKPDNEFNEIWLQVNRTYGL